MDGGARDDAAGAGAKDEADDAFRLHPLPPPLLPPPAPPSMPPVPAAAAAPSVANGGCCCARVSIVVRLCGVVQVQVDKSVGLLSVRVRAYHINTPPRQPANCSIRETRAIENRVEGTAETQSGQNQGIDRLPKGPWRPGQTAAG